MTIQDNPDRSRRDRLWTQVVELQRFYGILPMPPGDPFALFAWEVLALKTWPAGRDAAFAALRRAHILTPDAVVRAPRAALEAAVAAAGPSRELRLDALRAGAEIFRRNRTLPAAIRGPLSGPADRSASLLNSMPRARIACCCSRANTRLCRPILECSASPRGWDSYRSKSSRFAGRVASLGRFSGPIATSSAALPSTCRTTGR